MEWTEEPLNLDLPAPIVRQARHPPAGKVTWPKYRPANPVHCDDCLAEIHRDWPDGARIPHRALFKRVAGDKVTFMCAEHAQAQRVKDGMAPGRRTK